MRKMKFGLAIAVMALAPAMQASADEATDRAVAQQIAANLKESGKMRDYRVGVKYEDGVAWLMGSVTSPQQKQLAQKIAASSEGVDKVINRLEVSGKRMSQQNEEPASSTLAGDVEPAASYEAAPYQGAPMPAGNGMRGNNMPVPMARMAGVQPAGYGQYCGPQAGPGGPSPMGHAPTGNGGRTVSYDNPSMPNYAWPSYASYPNYAAVTYPQQYSASAWPYIGPFYPYPQVPLGWRKVTLEWDDGWWMLDFKDCKDCH